MPTRAVDQLALDEQRIDDLALEQALERRLSRRLELADARKNAQEADEEANVEIAKLELPTETAVRCGRFRITRSSIPARSVSFEVASSSRVRITLLGDA